MEYTQWGKSGKLIMFLLGVLILVVMEYTQWVLQTISFKISCSCLNPCCNGIYSMSRIETFDQVDYLVLILVVMEYTQWV